VSDNIVTPRREVVATLATIVPVDVIGPPLKPAPVLICCTVPLPADVAVNETSAFPAEPVATVTKILEEFTKFNFLAVKMFPV